jgi:hypothetical protein
MPKFDMKVNISPYAVADVTRLGAGSGSANYLRDTEVGKFVKLVANSRYNLCVVGDAIEGVISSVEPASQDDFSMGSVRKDQPIRVAVILDGLQATPGTGAINVGDLVVCGTPVAKDTALPAGGPRVCRATAQTAALFNWRLISATGSAVGSTGIIERV